MSGNECCEDVFGSSECTATPPDLEVCALQGDFASSQLVYYKERAQQRDLELATAPDHTWTLVLIFRYLQRRCWIHRRTPDESRVLHFWRIDLPKANYACRVQDKVVLSIRKSFWRQIDVNIWKHRVKSLTLHNILVLLLRLFSNPRKSKTVQPELVDHNCATLRASRKHILCVKTT